MFFPMVHVGLVNGKFSAGGNVRTELAVQHALDVSIYDAVDVAAHAAIDVHCAAGRAGHTGNALHLKARALDDGVTQDQDLRQDEQNQNDGNDRAAA